MTLDDQVFLSHNLHYYKMLVSPLSARRYDWFSGYLLFHPITKPSLVSKVLVILFKKSFREHHFILISSLQSLYNIINIRALSHCCLTGSAFDHSPRFNESGYHNEVIVV